MKNAIIYSRLQFAFLAMPRAARSRTRFSPRKQPQQARSKAMVAAILEAAIRVLIKRGYQGATTIAIAERAGVSVGSLYQYFPNKEEIVGTLIDQHARQIIACVDAALDEVDPDDPGRAIEAMIQAAIKAHRINAPLHKVLTEQVPRVGRIKVAMDTSKVLTERLASFLTAHRAHLNGRDPQRAAFVVETVVEALTHRAVIEHPDALSTGDIEAEALELVMGYLFSARR